LLSLDLEIYRRLLTAIALKLVFNPLSFVQRGQSGTFDSADVNKHIFATALRLNEPITLRWIEPLHRAGSHAGLLVESNCNRPTPSPPPSRRSLATVPSFVR